MNIAVKLIHRLILTVLVSVGILGGLCVIPFAALTGKYLLESNWDKFLEFFLGLIGSVAVIWVSSIIGAKFRALTRDPNDPKDKSIFDSF